MRRPFEVFYEKFVSEAKFRALGGYAKSLWLRSLAAALGLEGPRRESLRRSQTHAATADSPARQRPGGPPRRAPPEAAI
jgi:hypothetical protein